MTPITFPRSFLIFKTTLDLSSVGSGLASLSVSVVPWSSAAQSGSTASAVWKSDSSSAEDSNACPSFSSANPVCADQLPFFCSLHRERAERVSGLLSQKGLVNPGLPSAWSIYLIKHAPPQFGGQWLPSLFFLLSHSGEVSVHVSPVRTMKHLEFLGLECEVPPHYLGVGVFPGVNPSKECVVGDELERAPSR